MKNSSRKFKSINHPIISICFEPYLKSSSLTHLNTTLSEFMLKSTTEYDAEYFENLPRSWHSIFHEASYKIGTDFTIKIGLLEHESIILDSTNLSEKNSKLLELEEIYTEWSGICYKLTMKENTTTLMRNYIGLEFKESLPKEDIPEVKFYFTSENNSYGVIPIDFIEGNVLMLPVKVEKNLWHKVKLSPMEYEKFELTSECSQNSYYECLADRYKNFFFNFLPITIITFFLNLTD